MSNSELTIHFAIQIAVILGTCRVTGLIIKRFGQPEVIGEMIAGIILGPSVFGFLWPNFQQQIFPAQGMGILYVASQVGLILFMFLIGIEFDTNLIRDQYKSAGFIAVAGIITPLILGSFLAFVLFKIDTDLFGPKVEAWQAMLFIGVAMSITAFPVLARIIMERGLMGTRIGTLALAAGSMNDVAAWSILAILLAIFKNDLKIAAIALVGGGVYVALMAFVARPLLKRLGHMAERHNGITGPMLGMILPLIMLSGAFTEYIGIHAVFGAFILGLVMPKGLFAVNIRKLIEPMVTYFMVPLFFVYSGLNTRFGLVNTIPLLLLSLVVLLNASCGKGVACWLAARLSGSTARDARGIGILMNTRGLMELILLNIGLDLGIISPTLFTIMVSMAVVTTFMAIPLFELIYGRHEKKVATALLEEMTNR